MLQTQKENSVFSQQMQKMFKLVCTLEGIKDEDAFKKKFEHISKPVDISDKFKNEIGRNPGGVGETHLSDDTKDKLRSMLRLIGELIQRNAASRRSGDGRHCSQSPCADKNFSARPQERLWHKVL